MSEEISLQGIRRKNAERLQRLGVTPSAETMEAALLQMVATLGQLATLSYRGTTTLSPFEQQESAAALGRMTVAMSTIGYCLDVDIGAAALEALGTAPAEGSPVKNTETAALRARTPPTTPAAEAPRRAHSTPAAPIATPLTAPSASQPSSAQPVMLSPTSRESFFTYLDRLADAPREVINQANLRWVVPEDNGKLGELVPDGCHVPVAYEQFSEYLKLVQARRRRPEPQRSSQQAQGTHSRPLKADATALDDVRRDDARASAAQVLADEARLFSPTHFSGGLFSPMAGEASSDLMSAGVRPPLAMERATSNSPTVQRNGGSILAAVPPPPLAAVSGVLPTSQPRAADGGAVVAQQFETAVHLLRTGYVKGPQVAQLGLSFCYPDGEKVVDLVNDGMQIAVTSANVKEFLRLLDDAQRNARPPMTQRIHRVESVRRLQAAPPPAETGNEGFSPSHFSHGLFAPHDETSTFYVDYDATDRILPPFLRGGANSQAQQQQQQSGLARTDAGKESIYMTAVRRGDFETLQRIVGEVRADMRALAYYGVTYCVPSALEPTSSSVEQRNGVHEFFPHSSSQLVEAKDLSAFLTFVDPYFRAVR